jgi:hypothetical protein
MTIIALIPYSLGIAVVNGSAPQRSGAKVGDGVEVVYK